MGAQPTPEEPSSSGESVPRPDPTTMTSRQLSIAIDSLKELLRAEVHGLVELQEVRFESMERAGELLQVIVNNQPLLVAEKIAALQELHNERFGSIQTQFLERDVRTEQTSRDSKVAVDAALQAAKEAVGKQQEASDRAIAKSETSTTKQLEALQELIRSNTKAIDDKVGDLKERLTRIDGTSIGNKEAGSMHSTTTATQISVAGVLIALVVGGSTLLARRDPPVAVVVPAQVSENTARLDAITRQLELQRQAPATRP